MLGAANGAVAVIASSSPDDADSVSRSISVQEATATDRSTSEEPAVAKKMSLKKKPSAIAAITAVGHRVVARATAPATSAPARRSHRSG